jgi:hypothetical protein
MMQRTALIVGLSVVLSTSNTGSAQNDAVESITTLGVLLPERISVGDRVELSFGSNPKNYTFQITRIRLNGEGCRALSNFSGPDEDGEKDRYRILSC